MGRGRKKTSNKSTPYLNLKGLKTKSYEPENYENINPEDLSDDEIDAFIKANEDKISLKGTKYDREDDGNRGLSYDNDIVMDLPDDIYDDDDDDDDTNRYGKKQSLKDAAIEAVNRRREQERAMNPDEDEDEETLEDAIERDQAVGGWGHKKASYYEEHSSERSSALMPSQASRSEELEARRLQKMHNSAIDEEDFAGTLSVVAESDERESHEKGQGKISVEREMVEEISKDLNDISILGDRSGMERIEKKLEGLSDEEKLGILQQNSPELIALVNEFKSSLTSIKMHYAPAMKLIDKEKSVKDHPVIEELVRIRTFFEKIAPVEIKFKSKIKKLFKNLSNPTFSLSSLFGSADSTMIDEESNESEAEEDEISNDGLDFDFDLKTMLSSKSSKSSKMSKSAKKTSIKSFVAKKYKNTSLSTKSVSSAPAKLVDETGEREEYYASSDDEKSTFSADQKKTLTQTINDIAQVAHESGQLRRKRMLSGDQDFLPQQERQNKRQKIAIPEVSQADPERVDKEVKGKAKKGPSEGSVQEKKRRDEARIAKGMEILAADNLAEGAKRDVSRKIEKNRGLVRPRSVSHGTTPHSRVRAKFQKKLRSGSGVMPAKRDKSKPFTGEKNGIKPSVVHSTKF